MEKLVIAFMRLGEGMEGADISALLSASVSVSGSITFCCLGYLNQGDIGNARGMFQKAIEDETIAQSSKALEEIQQARVKLFSLDHPTEDAASIEQNKDRHFHDIGMLCISNDFPIEPLLRSSVFHKQAMGSLPAEF